MTQVYRRAGDRIDRALPRTFAPPARPGAPGGTHAFRLQPLPDGAPDLLAFDDAIAVSDGLQSVPQLVVYPEVEAAACHGK